MTDAPIVDDIGCVSFVTYVTVTIWVIDARAFPGAQLTQSELIYPS